MRSLWYTGSAASRQPVALRDGYALHTKSDLLFPLLFRAVEHAYL